MNIVKNRIIQPIICNDDQFGNLVDPYDAKSFHPRPKVLNIFPTAGDPSFLAKKALESDLSEVVKLRIDPINKCNLQCIFCTTNLQEEHSQIEIKYLSQILNKISKTCQRISLGCHFEPLMAKNIDEYLDVIDKTVKNFFKNKPIVTMVTNGLLLDKRNINLIEILDWIHISVHSHKKENFELIEKNAKFETLVKNIKYIRNKFKNLNIHIEFVANKKNKNDIEEFIPWALNELNVNSLNIRRVGTKYYAPNSYLEKSINNNQDLSISDTEWINIEKKILSTFPQSKKNKTPGFGLDLSNSPSLNVIEL